MSASFTLDEAFARCAARARQHYENFPVGLFVPKPKRKYVHALYAFMRVADDFSDEPIYEGESLLPRRRASRAPQARFRPPAGYSPACRNPSL